MDAAKATNIIDKHRVCAFACHRVSQYAEYQTEPLVYSGPGVMDKFYDHIMRESEVISAILANDRDMAALTAQLLNRKTIRTRQNVRSVVGRLPNQIIKCDIMTMLLASICFLPVIAVTLR